MATDTEILKDLLLSKFSTKLGNAEAKSVVGRMFTDSFYIHKPAADSMAADTTAAAAMPVAVSRNAGQIKNVWINPNAALTGHATTNAVFTIKKYAAAGGAGTSVATLTTTVANSFVAFSRIAMTLTATAADLTVVAGGFFTCEIAKGSTGVIVPICNVQIDVERTA